MVRTITVLISLVGFVATASLSAPEQSSARDLVSPVVLGSPLTRDRVSPTVRMPRKRPGSIIQIHTIQDLQNMQNNLSGSYQLQNDIDATGFSFAPVGTASTPFTGMLDGNGFAIKNLSISSTLQDVGLFGYLASGALVLNVRVLHLQVSVNGADGGTCNYTYGFNVGGIAGSSEGTINVAYVQGTVTVNDTSTSNCGIAVGGVVGFQAWQSGGIASAQSNIAVSASSLQYGKAGGLVGAGPAYPNAAIDYCSSFGNVALTAASGDVGGLVGSGGNGSISNSFATGAVVGTATSNYEMNAGGLVGTSEGNISNSFASGTVNASTTGGYAYAGGLVGQQGYGSLQYDFARGDVTITGRGSAGGLAAWLAPNIGVTQSYSTGAPIAPNGTIGGLIASNDNGSVSDSYWDINTSGTKQSAGGVGLTTNKMQDGKLDHLVGFDPSIWEPVRIEAVDPPQGYYPQLWLLPFPITSFPLSGYTPNTVPIVTVFDHSMEDAPNSGVGRLYACDNVVRAFTSISGELQYGSDSSGCKYPGYKKSDGKKFVLNGLNYTGTNGDGPKYLEYDGHPGFDYRASSGTVVYAAASGIVFYPWRAVGTGSNNDTYCRFHTLAQIPDSASAYRIYYLHLSTHPARKGQTDPKCNSKNDSDGQTVVFTPDPNCVYTINGQPFPVTSLPLPEGAHVQSGCPLALSGWAGLKNENQAHLHFEIQQIVPVNAITVDPGRIAYFPCFDENKKDSYKQGTAGVAPYCFPDDPYGWTGSTIDCSGDPQHWHDDGTDIWGCLTGIPARRFWAQ